MGLCFVLVFGMEVCLELGLIWFWVSVRIGFGLVTGTACLFGFSFGSVLSECLVRFWSGLVFWYANLFGFSMV